MGEAGASPRGGLSAAELATETLFPGDTIEYFSMAFVAGDPRGHRLAKVLRVQRSDEDFPIRVETQEMLPLTMMLKRKRDRLDREIPSSDAKWRKLRTFRLVDGEVEGETRAQRLNAGLKKVVGEAFAAVRKQLVADNAQAKSRQLMQSFFKPAAPKEKENEFKSSSSDDDDDGDDFEASTLSKKKAHAGGHDAKPQPVKRVPLGATRDRGNGGRSVERVGAKKRKLTKQRRDQEPSARPQHKSLSPSPRRVPHRERESSRPVKRKRLDFTNGQSSERQLGDTTAADEDDSGDASRSVKRSSPAPASHRHVTPEKKRKVMLQKFVNQIQEKKAGADINEYIALDKQEQEAKQMLKAELSQSSSRPAKTLQLNTKSAEAHRWQDDRKKFRDSQASRSGGITSWLSKRLSKTESGLASPSPSKKRRDREAKRASDDAREETALEAMLNEVFEEPGSKGVKGSHGRSEKQDRSVSKVGSTAHRTVSDGGHSTARHKSGGKSAKAIANTPGRAMLMDKWIQRRR